MTIKILLSLLACSLIVIFFQNCDPFTSNGLPDNNSLCIKKNQIQLFQSLKWSPSICSNLSSFKCSVAIFRPHIKNGDFSITECFSLQSTEFCKEIQGHGYNTSEQLNAESIQFFKEGASYNRSEYTCTIPTLTRQGIHPIQAEALLLSKALELAKKKCLEGAQ